MLRILLLAAAIAALSIVADSPTDAKPTVATLASSERDPVTGPVTVVVKPDEVRNARPRKKPRMVLRCALFGRYIQGCNPG